MAGIKTDGYLGSMRLLLKISILFGNKAGGFFKDTFQGVSVTHADS
jgi:hypothetical protein